MFYKDNIDTKPDTSLRARVQRPFLTLSLVCWVFDVHEWEPDTSPSAGWYAPKQTLATAMKVTAYTRPGAITASYYTKSQVVHVVCTSDGDPISQGFLSKRLNAKHRSMCETVIIFYTPISHTIKATCLILSRSHCVAKTDLTVWVMDFRRPLKVCCDFRHQNVRSRSFVVWRGLHGLNLFFLLKDA